MPEFPKFIPLRLEKETLPELAALEWHKDLLLAKLQPSDLLELTAQEASRGDRQPDVHWRWRHDAICKLASQLDPTSFDLKALYLHGSVEDRTSGPSSDIDLITHINGKKDFAGPLLKWFEEQGRLLSHIYKKISPQSYDLEELFDVHVITDLDVERRTGFAATLSSLHASRPRKLI